MGNCSLSAAIGSKKNILDLFCRVESLPRDVLSQWLGDALDWSSVRDYYEHLGDAADRSQCQQLHRAFQHSRTT